jgi:regulator of sirC expression with transglutaminase-like and TPR domain
MQPTEFAAITSGPDSDVDLVRAALAIGYIVDPHVNVEVARSTLETLAERVRVELGNPTSPTGVAERVCAVLFEDEGFAGDTGDYYHPRNSSLAAVLERRRGMPILLSVLYIEVARRVGLDVQGVGAPGHFLVKFNDGLRDRYLDPYNGGRHVPTAELRAALHQTLAGASSADAYLEAVTKRQILARILVNLKSSYLRRDDPTGALRAVDYLLAMSPWVLDEVRDRGLLLADLGRHQEALVTLRQFREHAPDEANLDAVDGAIRRLEHHDGNPSAET